MGPTYSPFLKACLACGCSEEKEKTVIDAQFEHGVCSNHLKDCRDASGFNSTCCSCKRLELSSQHPHQTAHDHQIQRIHLLFSQIPAHIWYTSMCTHMHIHTHLYAHTHTCMHKLKRKFLKNHLDNMLSDNFMILRCSHCKKVPPHLTPWALLPGGAPTGEHHYCTVASHVGVLLAAGRVNPMFLSWRSCE